MSRQNTVLDVKTKKTCKIFQNMFFSFTSKCHTPCLSTSRNANLIYHYFYSHCFLTHAMKEKKLIEVENAIRFVGLYKSTIFNNIAWKKHVSLRFI